MGRLGKLAAEVPWLVNNLIGFDAQGAPLTPDEDLAKQFQQFAGSLPNMIGQMDPELAPRIDELAKRRFTAMDPAIRSRMSERIQQLPVADELTQALPGAMGAVTQEAAEDPEQSESPGATPPSATEEAAAASVGQPPPEEASASTAEDSMKRVQERTVRRPPPVDDDVLGPEREATRDMAREVLETAPLQELPQFTGYDAIPNQNLNARDRFGNYYYIDPEGRTFKWSQTGEPGKRLTRVPHLEASAEAQQDIERQLIREMSAGTGVPRDPEGRAQWAQNRRQQLAAELGGPSEAAQRLGLTRLDDAMAAAGGPVYFDRQGRPHALSEQGLQRMSSIDLWRQANPERAAAYDARDARRERRLNDPRYLASLRRSYQTTGEEPPEWFQNRVAQMEQQDPNFREKMDAHVVAGQMLQDRGFQKGINYTDLYNQARQQIGGAQQPAAKTPPSPIAPEQVRDVPPTTEEAVRPPQSQSAPTTAPGTSPAAKVPPKQPKTKTTVTQPQNKLGAQFFNVTGHRGGLRDKHLRQVTSRFPQNRYGALPPHLRRKPYLGTPAVFQPGRDYSSGQHSRPISPKDLQGLIRKAQGRAMGRRNTRQLQGSQQYRPRARTLGSRAIGGGQI